MWCLAAAMALGLVGCDSEPPPPPPEPGGGFKAAVEEGVKAGLALQKSISADAALIQGVATLDNHSGDVAVVTVPRSCDVLDWVIRDTAGKLVMAKGPIECVAQETTKSLEPNSTLKEAVYLYLMPRVLESGTHYVIEYRFWGQPARVEFTTTR